MNHEMVENVPCEAPFSDGAASVTLRRDPKDRSSFVGTVPRNHPFFKSIITVSKPRLPSGQVWSDELVESFEVKFPQSQRRSEDLSFDLRENIGWSHDRGARDYPGTATKFTSYRGELPDTHFKALPVNFEVEENLVLDPHLASLMNDEEPKRFQGRSVSDVAGNASTYAHHRQMAPNGLGAMDKLCVWRAFRRGELS